MSEICQFLEILNGEESTVEIPPQILLKNENLLDQLFPQMRDLSLSGCGKEHEVMEEEQKPPDLRQ